jgi:transposase
VIDDLVPDALWERVAPLLPAPPAHRYRYPGRKQAGDRAALAGIVFVLKTGIAWNQLPRGCAAARG